MPTRTSIIICTMNRHHSIRLILTLQCVCLSGFCLSSEFSQDTALLDRPPVLKPDYTGITIPPNIAPLNFLIQESGDNYRVRISGVGGKAIELQSKSGRIRLPSKAWHKLLDLNKGRDLQINIQAQTKGQWTRFAPITNHIAEEEIDPFLIYRKIHPAHNSWMWMGLFQRDLRNFEETQFLDNKRFSGDCCHCHMLQNNNPDQMMVLIRSTSYENSALIIHNEIPGSISGQIGFVSWHPQTPIIAASFSKPRLILHTARNDMRDIIELYGWIGTFDLTSQQVEEVPGLRDETRLMAFPLWAPDGQYLYYCSAPVPKAGSGILVDQIKTIKYDLMRISFNFETNDWGTPEPVALARDTGFSIAQPRISPDGTRLFVCGIPYGCWPAYDRSSDLYSIDLSGDNTSGTFPINKLSLNSEECESWLSWSTNSRWIVFSSKRLSPLINRPFMAYVASDGTCSKPFLLPQRDPEFYDTVLQTYTIPTLAIKPVTVPQRELIEAIKNADKSELIMPGPK